MKYVETSGGDYTKEGPVIKKGRYKNEKAMGAYQVMPSNLALWSKAALGREVTKEEFLKSPKIQDAIFKDQIKKSMAKHDSVDDAVSIWFTGRPVNEKSSKASDGSTTGAEYLTKFNRALRNTSS